MSSSISTSAGIETVLSADASKLVYGGIAAVRFLRLNDLRRKLDRFPQFMCISLGMHKPQEIWIKFSVAAEVLVIRNLAGTLQNLSKQAFGFEWAGDICILKFLLAFEIRNNITLKFHLQRATRFLHKYSMKDEDAFPIQTDSSFLNTRLRRS